MNIGVLGGGQLGQMLALAGLPLGLNVRCWDPSPQACAQRGGELLAADWDNPGALDRFTRDLSVATFEFENVPAATAEAVAQRVPLFPPLEALTMKQDRLTEKRYFERLGLPVAPFMAIDSPDDLPRAAEKLGLPLVVKTRVHGYDGKGQRVLRTTADLDGAWRDLGKTPLVAEAFVSFDREISIIAVRSKAGSIRFYPVAQNVHVAGILWHSQIPLAGAPSPLQALAESHATKVLEALKYVGVLAIEFFVLGDKLLANEMAPRVHNTGHWTIEGAHTSQFENHLRAVCGLPLGSTATVGASAMINLIGHIPPLADLLRFAGAHVHLYGKSPKPGRKVGHVTLCANSAAALAEPVRELLTLAPVR